MKRFFFRSFVLSLLGLSLLVSSVLSPLTASAASIYDNSYQTTPNILLGIGDGQGTQYNKCTKDITTTWASDFQNASRYSSAPYNSFANARDNGGRWGVSISYGDNGDQKMATVYWSTDSDAYLSWYEGGTVFHGENLSYANLWLMTQNGTPNCDQVNVYDWYQGNSPGSWTVSSADTEPNVGTKNVFVYVDDDKINKPTGYAGIPVRTSLTADNAILRPNVVADVNDKHVAIKSKRSAEFGETPYKIYWLITNANFDGDGPEIPFSLEGYSEPDNYLSFDVPSYETINVSAYFVNTDGSSITGPDDYVLKETSINLLINGSIYSTDSDKLECNDDNFCESPVSEWEDETCDLTHLGGCVANIWHYFLKTLGIEKTSSNPTGSPFVTFTTDTKGLTAVITAPLTMFNNLSQSTYTCSPIVMPLPFVSNRNITLPCLSAFYTTYLGNYYTMYQTIINGIVAYYVLLKMLALVKGFKDPQNDKIEATAL